MIYKENLHGQDPDPAKKNVAAIFGDLGETVSLLDKKYRKQDEVSKKAQARFQRSTDPELERAVSQMYGVAVLLESEGSLQSFLDERGVKAHGNVKNMYALLVQACIGSVHRSLKSALCKRAAVIALARRHDVTPEDFEKWRQLWPVERACDEFRRLTNHGVDEPGGMDTRGLTGEKIARVEFVAGKVKVLEILKNVSSGEPMPSTATPT